MRYIRTKDGKIYELQETKSGEKYLVRTNELIPLWNTKAYEIVKQADTIEELCDRYVLHHTDIIFLNKEHTKYRFENEPNNWYDITETEIRVGVYGAIWTEKGLIYVAKMNKKGCLELL